MDPIPKKLLQAHISHYGSSPWHRLFSCPGRINLIGEHIDYNGGHVLPAAINQSVYLCISPGESDTLKMMDMQFELATELKLHSLHIDEINIDRLWLYPYGAVRMFGERIQTGLNFSFLSTIPAGAGVSSSAAITTVTLYSLSKILEIDIPSEEMAKMGQRVEKEYAGVSCGIMDQFAVINGKKNHALLLDTRSLDFEYLPVDSTRVHFILVNSGIKHSLRETGYNDRRNQCENALKILQRNGFNINFLCDLSGDVLKESQSLLPETEFNRALHAVTENERTLAFYKKIQALDFTSAGSLLYDSHNSLKDRYEVSIPEIDLMVQCTESIEGVYGARMMGGGFGGCTINMVASPFVETFMEKMAYCYRNNFKSDPMMIDCTLEDGVRELTIN